MKILIAEDDSVTRRVLERTLDKWGYEVISTVNGAEAWEVLQSEKAPHIAILDWMMPEIDGTELVRRTRANKNSNYTYTILLTAKSQKEDIVAGIEMGADDYLTKPFDRNELRARLRTGERIINLEQTLARNNKELEGANHAISSANERMKNDLQAAAKIQQSLLPTLIPKTKCVETAWLFNPCEELAGDTLNIFPLDDKHLALYLLDVSGHGVQAALLSVTLSRILSPSEDSILRVQGNCSDENCNLPPAEVAQNLNRRFLLDESTGQYFTLIYGILNTETCEFRFISAGHPSPFLLSGGHCQQILKSSGLPIGFLENETYQETAIQLKPGDRLYFYSDGLIEALNSNNEQSGDIRLMQLAMQHSNSSLKENLRKVVTGVREFTGKKSFADDISIVAIEITSASLNKSQISRAPDPIKSQYQNSKRE